MFLLYSILSFLIIILIHPWYYLKRSSSERHRWLNERWARIPEKLVLSPSEPIWLHAVSVGEVMAALPLLRALKKRFPGKKILLTTVTETGQHVAMEKFPEADCIAYLPWDIAPVVNKVVSRLRPSIFITIETELWPNLLRTINAHGIPIIVLNGRISEGSFHGYRRIRFFMKRVLSLVDFFGMQDDIDAERIISIGAEPSKVRVIGNFKFDYVQSDKPIAWAEHLKRPAIIAGSTHRGEEEMILDAYTRLSGDWGLILAPRHPERAGEVEGLLDKRGLPHIRRSGIKGPFNERIIILDTIGELSSLYRYADIAVVGGSLLPFGGHNPIEPAFWAGPIIFGPHMENFPIAKEFIREGGAIEVRDVNEMVEAILWLTERSERAEKMGAVAKAIVQKNIGAVERSIGVIEAYLGNP